MGLKLSIFTSQVRSEVDPYLRVVSTSSALTYYDLSQCYSPYTTGHTKKKDVVTHSSYWFSRTKLKNISANCKNDCNNGFEKSMHQVSSLNNVPVASILGAICISGNNTGDDSFNILLKFSEEEGIETSYWGFALTYKC